MVQLYLSFPKVAMGAPLRALRGFRRVHLKPGESQTVRFELKDRDLHMVSGAGDLIVAEGSIFHIDWRWPTNSGRIVGPGERSSEGTKTFQE